MWEFLVIAAAFIAWVALWAASACVLTALSIVVAVLLERYLLVPERLTYPLWIVALSVCPLAAFLGSWTLCGLVLSERFYHAVRFGGIAAGIMYGVIGVLVVARGAEKQDKASEVATLIGSLITDGLCCVALVWFFPHIAAYMRLLGGG